MKRRYPKNGARDGQLVVVSRDLFATSPCPPSPPPCSRRSTTDSDRATPASRIPGPERRPRRRTFDPALRRALPRAYQWLDASAYLNHVDLTRRARGGEMPPSFLTDPLMYQGASDDFMGPRDPITAASEDLGVDLKPRSS